MKKTLAERFWEKVDRAGPPHPLGQCWVWTAGCDGHGYGQIGFGPSQNRRQPLKRATHIAWLLETGELPNQLVLHHCDNPKCVRFSHLFLGSHRDNAEDMLRKGRGPIGDRNVHSKLSPSQVNSIKQETGSQREIAAKYGINQSQVSRIRNGKRWAYATLDT